VCVCVCVRVHVCVDTCVRVRTQGDTTVHNRPRHNVQRKQTGSATVFIMFRVEAHVNADA